VRQQLAEEACKIPNRGRTQTAPAGYAEPANPAIDNSPEPVAPL
jgi:hypothetical protein